MTLAFIRLCMKNSVSFFRWPFIVTIGLWLLGNVGVQAQTPTGPQVKLHTPSYQDGKGGHYLEISLFCLTGSLAEPVEGGQKSLELEILLFGRDSLRQKDTLYLGDKVRLKAPVESALAFSHLLRYRVSDGTYGLQLSLKDPHSGLEPAVVTQSIVLKTELERCFFSELRIGEQLQPAQERSPFNRYGMEFRPTVGDAILPQDAQELPLFVELYNADRLGVADKVSLRFEMLDRYLQPVPGMGGTLKKSPQAIVPILLAFPIAALEPGDYVLRLEALGADGLVHTSTETSFRKPGSQPLSSSTSTSPTLADLEDYFSDDDSLYTMLDILYPISTQPERRQEENLMRAGTPDQKRDFLVNFWLNRNPVEPEKALQDYLREVSVANNLYSTRTIPGYKTDRGRVYLQFGSPNMVEDRKYEPSLYPYEIWQYNVMNSPSTSEEVNRVFIFANTESAGDFYRLIHSNAEGEVFNQRWMLTLNRRTLPMQSVDETGQDIIEHGGRVNSNPIINESTINSINRR
ncbi:GWxTD domain-containing protein [bacterium]|nr:GWxTD domain-containing protein [bacterium]